MCVAGSSPLVSFKISSLFLIRIPLSCGSVLQYDGQQLLSLSLLVFFH